jgi:CheY-like chemotaxis protein
MNQLRVLLVEDNLINQELAKLILQHGGHLVEVAADGFESLESLANRDFDIVLMDVQMPNMDGLTATRMIRVCEAGKYCGEEISAELAAQLIARLRGRDLPIVAITANAMKGDQEECLAAGMDDYLTKPFQPEQIFATLKTVTEKLSAN